MQKSSTMREGKQDFQRRSAHHWFGSGRSFQLQLRFGCCGRPELNVSCNKFTRGVLALPNLHRCR